MSQLTYLMREICAGIEIFYSSKTGGQFWKTAFILCDNYTELASKLFLVADNPKWSDMRDKEAKKFEKAQKAVDAALKAGTTPIQTDLERLTKGAGKDNFKNYHDVLKDVHAVFDAKRKAELPFLGSLHNSMKARRDLRNDFFHSAKLLNLSIAQRDCVEAFCDLLDYGKLLFPTTWDTALSGERTLDTLEILLRLDRKCYSNPSITAKVSDVLKSCPRYRLSSKKSIPKNGVQVAEYPEDLHLMLSIIDGGQELRDKLAALLP
ncbi:MULTISPECIES: hypothetical protein [unclassified Microcoleus]|uniref:hypothetical protein n=1 Tax=unclassified Microcoleus TaxID=2642155 RepID=UPI002FD23700